MSELDQYKYLGNPKLYPKKKEYIYQTQPHSIKDLKKKKAYITKPKTNEEIRARKLTEEKNTG